MMKSTTTTTPPLLLALLAGTLAIGTASLPPLEVVQRMDRTLYDAWTRVSPPVFPSEIVVVDLEDSQWFDTLAVLARDNGARLSISTLDTPPRAASASGVLGPTVIAIAGTDLLRETEWNRGGVLWARPEFDGVVRHDQPIFHSEIPVPSLALVGSIALRQSDAGSMQQHEIIAYAQPLETDDSGRRWLRYFDRSTMRRLTPREIIENPAVLENKVVIAGRSAQRHTTPVGLLTTQEFVAHSTAGYWLDDSILPSLEGGAFVWGFSAVLLLSVALVPLGPLWSALLPVAGTATLLFAAAAAFVIDGLWIPSGGPALIALTGGAIALWLRRRQPSNIAATAADKPAQIPSRADALLELDRGEPVADGDRRTLGRYKLLKMIGRGAMGEVHVGRDPTLNRMLAIKTLNLAEEFDLEDIDEIKARFASEAELAGRLNHPNIVTVYDAGEENDVAYIAMEYARGRQLSDFTNPRRLLPVETTLAIVAKAAQALDYAHRNNVIHRDIKPANIMYDSDTETVKLTDFGMARLMDVSRTRTGIVLGTPSFMSPEQLEGDDVTGQTDLFALGICLYQLLTGTLPFRGKSMTELMFALANEPHAPISSVRSDLPRSIDRLIDRALAKKPSERFASGAEMASALSSVSERSG
ncbi:MAG TPA: serine/threonine-protein kinase [Gammaproteobacteria bacterium]